MGICGAALASVVALCLRERDGAAVEVGSVFAPSKKVAGGWHRELVG